MIWNPEEENGSGSAEDVGLQLLAEFEGVCGSGALGQPHNLHELACAIGVFLEQQGSLYIGNKQLFHLASQAFSSVGETSVARRLLICSAGLARPSVWEVTGKASVWALDLKQITMRVNPPLEIVFFNMLNIIIESVSELLDECRGCGVLGLKNVGYAAFMLLGQEGKKKDIQAFHKEIISACNRKLEQVCRRRRWEEIPIVLNLDVEV